MQPAYRILSAAALAFASVASFASTTTYTSSSAFLSNVAPGAYLESFDGLSDPPPGPASFSGGGFSYSASAPSDIYLAGGFLGASQIDEALTISFTSGNVKAIGANFFATDINDDFQAVRVVITLGDGTVEDFTPSSISETYRGFISTSFITSLIISGPGASLYAGLDNLTVGTSGRIIDVPEPTSALLVGLGMAGLLISRRRNA